VALTANVMAQDRARYEAEGFDACLGKPVERAAFERILAHYLPRASTLAAFTDLPEFAAIQASFVASLTERLVRMRAALARDDFAGAHMEAHMLKGSAASFGCAGVGRAAARLEGACEAADPGACGAAVDALAAAVQSEAPAAFLTQGTS
jgi:HPt (histidine-containing phosphotransfer) domain-containing protein